MVFNGAAPSGSLCLLSGPPRLPPKGGVQCGRKEDGVRDAFYPRLARAAPFCTFPWHSRAVDTMPLVSSKHMIPGNPGSRTGRGANALAAGENELMTKVLLIEDDS